MENNPDFRMAMLLQKQFDMEFSVERPPIDLTYEKIEKPKKSQSKSKDHSTKGSLIDPSWELVDPTPNIHLLFTQFNERFFWAKLVVVTVSWSKRMTTCAGICSYQGRAGICKITLSEPLLKLRPRKDLIETLLHEMIHAYLFVTHNNKDRDGHGPEFHKHMYRINGEAGTNITVYHDFHDEVRLYKQHWWRCNGPCQKRPPFFGMVRRAMNRAPGPNDRWFPQHQQTCSGTFIKVKEPEKVVKKKDEKIKNNNNGDITKFIKTTKNTTINTLNNTSNSIGTKNKNGTIVINPKTVQKDKENINNNTIHKPSTSTSNIVGFSDLTKPVSNPTLFTGPGQTLNQNKPSNPDYSTVRNHWLNKFSKESISKVDKPNLDLTADSSASKKRKIEEITPKSTDKTIKLDQINCPNCNKSIEQSKINAHLDLCLNADLNITAEFSDDSFNTIHCPVCNMSIDEDLLNRHLDLCLNGDDKCRNDDDKKVPTIEPVSSELIQCEVCDEFVAKTSYETHAQVCLDKLFSKYEESNSQMDEVNCLVCGKKLIKSALNEHLEECMGTVFEKNLEVNEENEEIEEEVVKFNCPICMSQVEEQEMNGHIDKCLQQKEIVNEFCD